MQQVKSFSNIKEMSIEEELKRLDVPIIYEKQGSSIENFTSNYARVSIKKPDGRIQSLGEIANGIPRIPYAQAMKWIIAGLKTSSIPFKLCTSILNQKCFDVYQEYILDKPIPIVDGVITPALIVRMSCSLKPPLTVLFGAYNYATGTATPVRTSDTDSCIIATRYNWAGLEAGGLGNRLSKWVCKNNLDTVSYFYDHLAKITSLEKIQSIFWQDVIPFCVRKKTLGRLEGTGRVALNSNLEGVDGNKFKGIKEFAPQNYTLIRSTKNLTARDVYFTMAEIACHLSSPARILLAGRGIDRVFSHI